MKPTREPSITEQEAAFRREWEQGAPANGRHDASQTRQDAPGRDESPEPAPEPESSRERLLAAARRFGGPFTAAGLTVAAWELFPETFGLKGWERSHPDSYKVREALYGRRGLLTRGLIRKRQDGLYEVPPSEE